MKIAFITGANGGIGKELCRELSRSSQEYLIIAAMRNLRAGENLIKEIQEESPLQKIELFFLDLSSFHEIQKSVVELKKKLNGQKISLLINNAGIKTHPSAKTKDGYPLMQQVNFIATSVFTLAVFSFLDSKAVILNISSMLYWLGSTKTNFFAKETSSKFFFKTLRAYGESKLGNLLFMLEASKYLQRQNKEITYYAVDPWIVSTKMITMNAWYDSLADIFFRPFIFSPQQAAQNILETLSIRPLPHGKLLNTKTSRKNKSVSLPARIRNYKEAEIIFHKIEKIASDYKILEK